MCFDTSQEPLEAISLGPFRLFCALEWSEDLMTGTIWQHHK